MLFPSNIFLFCFLPLILFFYYVIGSFRPFTRSLLFKNVVLFVGSLFFYAYGEGKLVLLLVASILFNYLVGLGLDKKRGQAGGKCIFCLGIFGNIALLFYYKYLGFAISVGNQVGLLNCKIPSIVLPIGISFFTFQAISYLADVYSGRASVQKNPLFVGLYIALFPQLIAGPILRYEDIAEQMHQRRHSQKQFAEGILRFIEGMAKKVLLADAMALFADRIFQAAQGQPLSVLMAWLGAISYTLQIYYDFSGYSDMAIGLGRMFGFTFAENFNYPYIATSVTDFWRRWHISLSTWFRDYVYIPLGGNRKGLYCTYRNLFLVWLLTGIWHGAGWTYILWGLWYFLFLVLEKGLGKQRTWKLPAACKHIYTLLVVILGWTIFRSPDVPFLGRYLGMLFGYQAKGLWDESALFYLRDHWQSFALALLFCMPVAKRLCRHKVLLQVAAGLLFLVSILYIWKGGYSPFIYFSF